MRNLILVRGLPGSGKSTLARLFRGAVHSADDFFVELDGRYVFDPAALPQAHAMCQRKTAASLVHRDVVAVANTFSARWEMEPYFRLANDRARVTVVDLFDAGLTDDGLAARCIHGVPVEAISAMRARWEHDWKRGNPIPPWERDLG